MLKNNTPVELYQAGGADVLVKREDLCVTADGPTFSKVRGLLPHMEALKAEGIKVVGYTETSISMAGWGVAWMAKKLGMKAVIFDPKYAPRKKLPAHLRLLDHHRKQWEKFGATVHQIPAGRAKVNYHFCKKKLSEWYDDSYMLPLGLNVPEAVDATVTQAERTDVFVFGSMAKNIREGTVVVNVGSGTICSGLLKYFHGLDRMPQIIGVMGRSGSMERLRKKIVKKSGVEEHGLFGTKAKLDLVDPGYAYTDPAEGIAPFPCHDFYDLKAWIWLEEHAPTLAQPILFWNIGSQRRLDDGDAKRRKPVTGRFKRKNGN